MIAHIENFTNQIEDGIKLASNVLVQEPENDIFNIVICGMGGSGIGGSIVKSILQDELEIPVLLVKTYDLPNFVNPNTLVICSSFSGSTEETISCYLQAKDRNAKVLCITSGGKLEGLAKQNRDDLILIPSVISSPRANIGYSIIFLLTALEKYNLISNSYLIEFGNLIKLLSQNNESIKQLAKSLSESFESKNIFIYSDDRFAPIIVRCQQQINENSKHFCHVNAFPEFNHNELVGWEYPVEMYNNSIVVFVKTDFDHPRVNKRMEICSDVFKNKNVHVKVVNSNGSSFLEQSFYIINLFDYVSVYLAEKNNVNPVSIEVIDLLKNKLSNE